MVALVGANGAGKTTLLKCISGLMRQTAGTIEYDGAPRVRDRLWWPMCEGVGAAHFLGALDGDAFHEDWYRRLWDFIARRQIDRRKGGWHPQLDDSLNPVAGYFVGKTDLYHALQACLIPLYPADGSLTRGILTGS